MALVTTQGFDLFGTPRQSAASGFQALQQAQTLGQRNLLADREAQVRQALSGALTPEMQPQTQQQQMLAEQSTPFVGSELAQREQPKPVMTQEQKIQMAMDIDPAIANQILKEGGLDDASKRAEASRFAAQLETVPFTQRRPLIEARIQDLESQGRDATHSRQLLDMDESTQNQGLLGVQLADLSTKERLTLRGDQAKAEAKRIESKDVKSSKILDDGTTIQVLKSGETRVISPTGAELQGAARSEAVKQGQEFGVDIQQRRAQARGFGKEAAEKSQEAIDTVGKLRSNNENLRQVIASVGAGADTGPIARLLPSFRAESVRLKNLRGQLGLDVVGSVTFGALSEKELEMAMDVGLPTGLDGPELVKWANDKIDAQEKLANYLEDQAIFLGERGNTVPKWIAEQKRKKAESSQQQAIQPQQPAQQPPTAKRIRFDAQGNIIQ